MYIGNLPKDTGERDLERFFRGYGRIRDVLIKNGYGFVELDDARDADDAVYELNGKRLLGERVSVERARGTPRGRDRESWGGRGGGGGGGSGGGGDRHSRRDYGGGGGGNSERYGPPTRTDHRLIVENLSSRVSWQDLKDYMRQAGEVTYADAHRNKNEGVVEFASYTDLKNALDKLDDTEINGRRIRLLEDRKRDRKSLSYSSRSRSRSRSRRRSRSPSASKSRSRSRSNRRSRSKSKSDNKRSSKSKSKSRSPARDKASKSRSRSRSRSARSRSRSPARKSKDRASRSASPPYNSHKKSKSKSRSRSRSRQRSRSHSRSQSPEK